MGFCTQSKARSVHVRCSHWWSHCHHTEPRVEKSVSAKSDAWAFGWWGLHAHTVTSLFESLILFQIRVVWQKTKESIILMNFSSQKSLWSCTYFMPRICCAQTCTSDFRSNNRMHFNAFVNHLRCLLNEHNFMLIDALGMLQLLVTYWFCDGKTELYFYLL